MRTARRSAAMGLALAVAGSLLWTGTAGADDHRPPRAVLRTPGKRQVGSRATWTWSRPDGEFCSIVHADGMYGWPRRLLYRAGSKVRVRLKRDERPSHTDVYVYRDVDEMGSPTTDARVVEHRLRRRETQRGEIWE